MRDIRNSNEDAGALPAGRQGSIRNIPLHRRTRAPIQQEEEMYPRPRRRRSRRFLYVVLAVLAVCALFGILISTVFAGATIVAYPRVEKVSLPATLLAQPNAPIGILPYQTISVTRSASVSVPASGTKKVSRPASGVLTVSNNFSSASQRLIANTRFEAQDGKIYRIRDSITVPGGSTAKPGTASATVYADSAGPDYNKSAGAVFTIPGFKGDPRYSKFSATAEGAISGGFTGDEPAIADSDLAAAKTALQQKLDADARAAAAAGIPEGSLAIPGALEISFMDLTQTPGANKTATLSQSASAIGIIVRQGDLAGAIAKIEVDKYQGEPVLFGDVSNMEISLATTSKRQDGTITLTLKGKATLVWQFDKIALVMALLGKGKNEFQTAVRSFQPAIKKADASIRPFWHGTFPSDINKISIKVEEEK